jgi:NAD(P)-dependent dehydrogenase (short-subunit alcohol dehydrogenase family)
MIDLKGKTAFVTGSSRGVGQQIVLGLAKLGCHIVVHGRTLESCAKTIELLKNEPIKTYAVYGELSEELQVKQLIKQVQSLNISIDILYNNAAVMTAYHPNYWEHSWEEWMLSMQVNVFAMYSLCSAFMPAMIENGFGRVVNLTSGIKDQPELAPYGASKWAVRKLTEDLAAKLRGTGVRINSLDPGWLRTDMGGANAEHAVEAVVPGALELVLLDDNGPNGKFFSAIK